MEVVATTPFGRRPMTLGMLESQIDASEIEPGKTVDKWKIFRALCEARAVIGVGDRALAVLNALLSFHPDSQLGEGRGLVVFPSNAQLSIRAHGMAPATLRRHLSDLVQAGLVIRRDSPNGKRYARKDAEGGIEQAFGFSLAPLVVRAEEIEAIASDIRAEQARLRITRENISLCRRDVSKLIQTAMEEGAAGDWEEIFLRFRAIVGAVPRKATALDLDNTLEDLDTLRAEILNRLEAIILSRKTSASESQTERLTQNSNTQPLPESEPRFETKQGAPLVDKPAEQRMPPPERLERKAAIVPRADRAGEGANAGLRPFPLGLVLQACPEIADYGPGGAVGNWRDLMSAAIVVRSMLGVSPSAYQDACEVMGPENAATVMACILERAGHINSAGGYLRELTRRADRGEFGIGPMLMALAKANGPVKRTG